MKVKPFLSVYQTKLKHHENTPDIVLKTIVDLIHPKNYISFNEKCELVENTLTSVKDEKYKTAQRYRNFIINLINTYTDLEVDNNGFDLLFESKLIDIILSTFESEYKMCEGLMTMYLEDEWR